MILDWVEFALIRLYNFSTFIKEDNKDLVGTGKNLTLDRCAMCLLLCGIRDQVSNFTFAFSILSSFFPVTLIFPSLPCILRTFFGVGCAPPPPYY